MTTMFELLIDRDDGRLLVGTIGARTVPLVRRDRTQTLCAVAVHACLADLPAAHPARLVRAGTVDTRSGAITVAARLSGEVERLWGAKLDRRQLRAVADARGRQSLRNLRPSRCLTR